MKLYREMESFITEASEEERNVLSGILKSLKNKRKHTHSTYISSLMDMKLNIINDHKLEITVPITPLLSNTIGIVHGGLTATLMDTAMGTAANQTLSEGSAAVTVEMKVNFTSPGTGSFLRCEAEVLNRGKKVIVTESKVYGDQNQLIAVSTGTFFIVRKA
ncbi:PaaI family thioesterase [Fictibacillus sp. KIGAM418]|uniref:PaaI family thioesterase n=1 Tax=Fictibacillus marinisediminis TaxID=2878389 RepID=A0A9X2BDP3_9BACL|nr:PaaI family thioesterase [Fictibacillus marinisediminis]MCK6256885.1 PaaI family thioesterase [Fictibacillus marinisediminis]